MPAFATSGKRSKYYIGVVGMLLIFCESFLPTSLLALTHSHTHTTPKKGIQKTDWRHTTACDGAMRSVASRAPDERVGFAQIVCEIVSRLCAHRAVVPVCTQTHFTYDRHCKWDAASHRTGASCVVHRPGTVCRGFSFAHLWRFTVQ